MQNYFPIPLDYSGRCSGVFVLFSISSSAGEKAVYSLPFSLAEQLNLLN